MIQNTISDSTLPVLIFYSWIDGWHSVYDWLDLVAPYENKHDVMVEYGDEGVFC